MSDSRKQRWHLIRESIKFQIKLTLDAIRDLLLSPVAITCTVLDLLKGNSKHQGYFQRLMLWGHSTDHWLNLFGDLPKNKSPESSEYRKENHEQPITQQKNDANATVDNLSTEKPKVDSKLDSLFSKIETILEEQQQTGTLTATAKQKIAYYLALLNTDSQNAVVTESPVVKTQSPTLQCELKEDEIKEGDEKK